MTTATEMKTQILTGAAEDGDFRTRLIADPKEAISAETGTTIPDGFRRRGARGQRHHRALGTTALSQADGGRNGNRRRRVFIWSYV